MKQNQSDSQACVVCGARRPMNAIACDATCRRAWDTGRSRAQQIKADMRAAEYEDSRLYEVEAAMQRRVTQILADENYNSPQFNEVFIA